MKHIRSKFILNLSEILLFTGAIVYKVIVHIRKHILYVGLIFIMLIYIFYFTLDLQVEPGELRPLNTVLAGSGAPEPDPEKDDFDIWTRYVSLLIKFVSHYDRKGVMKMLKDAEFGQTLLKEEYFETSLGMDATLRRFDVALKVYNLTPTPDTHADEFCEEVKDLLEEIVGIYQKTIFMEPFLAPDDADWDYRLNRIHEEVNKLLNAHKIGKHFNYEAWLESEDEEVMRAKESAHACFQVKVRLFPTGNEPGEWEWDDVLDNIDVDGIDGDDIVDDNID